MGRFHVCLLEVACGKQALGFTGVLLAREGSRSLDSYDTSKYKCGSRGIIKPCINMLWCELPLMKVLYTT